MTAYFGRALRRSQLTERDMAFALWAEVLPRPAIQSWLSKVRPPSYGGVPAVPNLLRLWLTVGGGPAMPNLFMAFMAFTLPCPISSCRLSKVRPPPRGRGPCQARPRGLVGWARFGLRPVGGGPAGPGHSGLVEQGMGPAPWAGALPGPISCAGWARYGLRSEGGGPALPNHLGLVARGEASALWAGDAPCAATSVSASLELLVPVAPTASLGFTGTWVWGGLHKLFHSFVLHSWMRSFCSARWCSPAMLGVTCT